MTYKVGAADDAIYTVTFKNGDATLKTDKYLTGGTVVYDGEKLVATNKLSKTYVKTFDKEGAVVSSDLTVSVQDTEVVAYLSGIKTNISLYNDFKYNYYIPTTINGVDLAAQGMKVTVEFGGESVTYTLSDYANTFTKDGVTYYVIQVKDIAPNAIAEEITFTISYNDELGNAVTAVATKSVLSYLEDALAAHSGNALSLDKAILKYAAAADVYFNDAVNAKLQALAEANGIENIGFTEVSGNATVPNVHVSTSLDLAAAPKVVIYLKSLDADVESTQIANVTVKYVYNGVTKTITESGFAPTNDGRVYLELELRGYEFAQRIEITVGETTIDFSLARYYAGITAAGSEFADDAELIALVNALNTYAYYAEQYKNN